MNLVNLESHITKEDGLYDVCEFHKVDYERIDETMNEIWAQLHELNEDFVYVLNKQNITSAYAGFGQNYETQYIVEQKFHQHANMLKINVPTLMFDTYFILSNSFYIPTVILERLPIDKNTQKNRVFISLNTNTTFAMTYNKKMKKYTVSTPKNKTITLDQFLAAVFVDRPDRLEELKEKGVIKKIHKYNAVIKEVAKSLGYYNVDFFKSTMMFSDFMNKYYTLPYHRELFKRLYNTEKFEDIVWRAVNLLTSDDIKLDLSDLRNRRLVMSEYLLTPVFDLYYRTLNLLVDKSSTSQMVLPSMNQVALITTGFRTLLHGKQLYDISTPFSNQLSYKISQKLNIIKENVPKSWTQLHSTHFRVIDPVNVSAQEMGTVITATRLAKVDNLGIFKARLHKGTIDEY